MKKALLLLLLPVLCGTPCMAQTDTLFSIAGHVIDNETGDTLPGALLSILDSETGIPILRTSAPLFYPLPYIQADENGYFHLDSLRKGNIIHASFIGYHWRQIMIEAPNEKLIIRLDPNYRTVEEYIILAYSISRKISH